MTVRHICSWQHQCTSRGRWALKTLLSESVWWTAYAGVTEKWLLNLPKGKTNPSGFLLHERVCQTLWGYRRKWLANCQCRQTCLWNFLLRGKVCWILWACRLKMDASTVQKNFVQLSRQWDVSVNSRVLDVSYNVLPVYLGNNISFWSFWWSWKIDR